MDMDAPKFKLKSAVDEIYPSIERTNWYSNNHREANISNSVKDLIKNNGDLEYFDRITFYLSREDR